MKVNINIGEVKWKKFFRRFNEISIISISAIGIAMLLNKYVLYIANIPSESMKPTLNVGDKLVVTKIYNVENLKRGDIVVFYSSELEKLLIKRLIGLPNDNISIKDGIVYVNGEKVIENYIKNEEVFNGDYSVPDNKYFFLGDNRDESFDSREWTNTYIEGKYIDGKAKIKIYPLKGLEVFK